LHDRILLFYTFQQGFGNWEEIRKSFRDDEMFLFDHFVKSRQESEIVKRIKKLIKVLEKEAEEQIQNKTRVVKKDIKKKNDRPIQSAQKEQKKTETLRQ